MIIDDFKQANNDLAKAAIRPDGYVLVPVEPTEKMFKAGLGWRESDSELEGEYRMVYESYKAMIQAAFEEGYKFANKENEEYDKTLTGDSAV